MLLTSIKSIIVTVVITVLLSVAPVSEALHSLFQSMDQDENGKIDYGEFSGNMTRHVFNRLDGNDNNLISRSEWDFVENVKDKELHNDLYNGMDIDRDSLISYKEFSDYAEKHSNIKETFMSLDKNRDGVLMPDDISDRPTFKMVTIRL